MTAEKIISIAKSEVKGNSLRDQEVKRLIDENLRVEKQGRWYIVLQNTAIRQYGF